MSGPLPRCPVCGRRPSKHSLPEDNYGGGFTRFCERTEDTSMHNIEVYGCTQAEADARWRRLAGAGETT